MFMKWYTVRDRHRKALSWPNLGEDVWENHNAGCPEDHDGPEGEEEEVGERRVLEKNPDREEGDGKEVIE